MSELRSGQLHDLHLTSCLQQANNIITYDSPTRFDQSKGLEFGTQNKRRAIYFISDRPLNIGSYQICATPHSNVPWSIILNKTIDMESVEINRPILHHVPTPNQNHFSRIFKTVFPHLKQITYIPNRPNPESWQKTPSLFW